MVVYDKRRHRAHRLNPTAAKVWSLLNGERSTGEIAVDLGVDESFVLLSVDHLASAHLLDTGEPLSVSRRAALRRVASAAAVGFLLPAVASIAAPFAAEAASNKGNQLSNAGGNGKSNAGGNGNGNAGGNGNGGGGGGGNGGSSGGAAAIGGGTTSGTGNGT